MKIDVIVPSRGNPLRLMSVLTAFDALSSGQNEINYRIVCDLDDPNTYKTAAALPFKAFVHCGEGSLHKRMNEAAAEGQADAVTTAGDDTFPLTQHWDGVIEAGISEGHPAFSWMEVNDPANTTNIVWSAKWLGAVGKMLPEWFPFWFGDTWQAEVHELAFLAPLPIVSNLQWGGKRGHTKGMRELAFWFEFFAATRKLRVGEARSLCFAYGRPYGPPQEMLDDMARRDAEQLKRVPEFEQAFGANQGEPSERYLTMKAAAEKWLSYDKEQVA